MGVVWQIHLNREHNDQLSSRYNRKKLVRGRVVFKRGYLLKCYKLAIPAKLHCPKGGRINESLLYLGFLFSLFCACVKTDLTTCCPRDLSIVVNAHQTVVPCMHVRSIMQSIIEQCCVDLNAQNGPVCFIGLMLILFPNLANRKLFLHQTNVIV